jgi:hypothetical protein
MLARNSYDNDYIAASRARVEAQLAAYRDLKAAADGGGAVAAFEPLFYDALIHELDNLFSNRQRGMEEKNGAAKQVRKLAEEDHEPFDEQAFIELSDAFFAEMERVYG